MQSVKQHLLAALAAELDALAPGTPVAAAFRVAAPGGARGLACTAAMQLAIAAEGQPASAGRAAEVGPAGHAGVRPVGGRHRDRRARLSEHPARSPPPSSRGARGAGSAARALRLAAGTRRIDDRRVRQRQPHRPRCTWPTAARRRWATRHLQPVRHPGLAGAPRVLLQRRGRADRDADALGAAARPGLGAGRRRLA